jgi:DNA repair protein RadA/Sms
LTEKPVPAEAVVFGEIALSGEVRPVGHTEARLKEAAKLGFGEAWMPARRGKGRDPAAGSGIASASLGHLRELVERLAPRGAGFRRGRIGIAQ